MHHYSRVNLKTLGATLIAVAALTAPAAAADLAGSTPYSPWAGFYAGTVYGAGLSLDRSSQTAAHSASGWGQTSGALIGYDFQNGRYVFGPEGELSFHILRPYNAGVPGGLSPNIDDTLTTDRLRLRLGYDLGAFLPFVAGGVATARIYQSGYPYPNVQWGQTRQVTGLTLGAGLEWRFDAPIIGPVVARGEYVLDAYPSASYAVYPGQPPIRTQNVEQFFRIGLISYMDPSWRPSAAAGSGGFDWSGPYAGVLGGGLWAQPRTSLAGASTTNGSVSGPAGGIFAGHNFAFGPWIAGFEGAIEITDASGTISEPTVAAVKYNNYFETDARARAGYAFGRFLPYVTAGLDWGRAEETDVATGSYRGRDWSDSVAVGGGVEYGFDDRWTARLEYLYTSSYVSNSTELDALGLKETRPAESIRAGLAYYFH